MRMLFTCVWKAGTSALSTLETLRSDALKSVELACSDPLIWNEDAAIAAFRFPDVADSVFAIFWELASIVELSVADELTRAASSCADIVGKELFIEDEITLSELLRAVVMVVMEAFIVLEEDVNDPLSEEDTLESERLSAPVNPMGILFRLADTLMSALLRFPELLTTVIFKLLETLIKEALIAEDTGVISAFSVLEILINAVFKFAELLTSAVLRLLDTLMKFVLMLPDAAVMVLLSVLETLISAVLRFPELLTSAVLRLLEIEMRFVLIAPDVAVVALLSVLETLMSAMLRKPELLTSAVLRLLDTLIRLVLIVPDIAVS